VPKLGAAIARSSAAMGFPIWRALAAGDRVRLFDRVHDGAQRDERAVLGSNGSVVEIRRLSQTGMVVRNEHGAEGW
jgi:hypothetical protein